MKLFLIDSVIKSVIYIFLMNRTELCIVFFFIIFF